MHNVESSNASNCQSENWFSQMRFSYCQGVNHSGSAYEKSVGNWGTFNRLQELLQELAYSVSIQTLYGLQ